MKTIKSFMLFAVIAMVAFAFTACGDDEKIVEKEVEKVVDRYNSEFALIDNQVKAEKKSDKAILLVAFGSTWDNAFKAFDATIAEYKKQFPGYDVYLSFSSDICINRAHVGENEDENGNLVARDYYSPNYWLHAIGNAQYKEIKVQSLQVIPGEEFAAVVACVKKFANNGYMFDARLDDEYLKNVKIYLGLPLLNTCEGEGNDVETVAKELDKVAGAQTANGVVAFMGHGNPDSYDTFKANIRYNQLEAALQAIKPGKYFVGCVDQPENFKPFVYERMKAAGVTTGNLYLYPLMSIAGDHAHNDMAGDDDAWNNGFEVNEEGEVEDTSWKMYFQHMTFTCPDENCTLKGLLELPGVRQVWMNHTKDAELLEDAYHSMLPE